MVDSSLMGKTGQEFVYQLTKEKIREYVLAVGDSTPLYVDSEHAKQAGYNTVIAPPTAIGIAMFDASSSLLTGINLAETVHGEQEFQFMRPVFAGETLLSQAKITEVYSKNKLDFIVIETIVSTEQGERVATAKATLIKRFSSDNK